MAISGPMAVTWFEVAMAGENEPSTPPPSNGGRRFVLRVVVVALAAIIASELFIAVGRGVVCAMKGGCGPEEWSNGIELLSGLVATLIALIFALLGERPPPP